MEITGLLAFTLLSLAFTQTGCDVVKVGNAIVEGRATGESDAKTIFLLDDAFAVDGVVFAFSAYFLSVNPVYIQIWRPVDPSDTSAGYRLLGQWMYNAIKANRREDIYLQTTQSSKTCFRVNKDDRLGLYFTEFPGSVAYDFVAGSVTTLRKRLDPAPSVNDVVKFDALAWPYKFSLAAYLDNDLSRYPTGELKPTCADGLVIPPEDDGYVNNTPTTAQPGATGATGPAGPMGSTGSTGPRGDQGQVGDVGSTGSTGERGPKGELGSPGVQGAIGPVGPLGGTGATGPQGIPGQDGEKGDDGERGPQGLPGNVTFVNVGSEEQTGDDKCVWCASFKDPHLILGVIIWLAVVSLLLLVTIVVVCTRRSKPQGPQYQQHAHNSDLWKKYENGGFDNEKSPGTDDNTYSAIEEGRTAF